MRASVGTILVDLERHRPVDLLSDRTSATLEQWLRSHPGVEIISRDRANDYAYGATRGAPDAIQVADRFHLLKNIRGMLERLLERNHTSLRSAAQEVVCQAATGLPPTSASSELISEAQGNLNVAAGGVAQAQPLLQSELRRQQHRARRFDLYAEVRRLQAEGMGIRAIARQLKISRESVRRFASDEFPEHARRASGRGKLDPHIPYLNEQLSAGRANAMQLWRELKAEHGYTGSPGLVSLWVAAHRSLCPPKANGANLQRGRPPKGTPRTQCPSFSTPSARKASWLLMAETASLSEDEAAFVACLCQGCKDACTGQLLALDFARMLRERDVAALAAWLARAQSSRIPEITNFVAILSRDLAAVTAAVKRTMYGRAIFELLKRRVLAA